MKLELKDEKGVVGTIELPLEQIKEALGLGSASVAESTEADAKLKESQDKVGELEEKLATAEGRTMHDYAPRDKATFVIAWAKGLSPEEKATFAEAVGIPLAEAPAAEAVEAEQEAKAEESQEPKIIQGKTDRPGYRFLEYLDLSVKEDRK